MGRSKSSARSSPTLETIRFRGRASSTDHAGAVNANSIAIVVIGRNEGQRLIQCLNSIGNLRKTTVYVDSGSHDGSPEAAARLETAVIHLDMSAPFTAARARNAGFAEVMRRWPTTQFVQFVDGDCTLDATWIATAEAFLGERSDVAIVFGRRRERFPERSVYNRLCDREWDGAPGEASECGGDIFVRVAALKTAGLYRETLIAGEEPELCVRLREKGWKIWRLPVAMTLHDANILAFRQWWLRSSRAGHAYAEVSALHRGSPHGIWRRSTIRAVLWGGVLPLAALFGALFHPAWLLLLLVYPLQVARLAVRTGARSSSSWRNAFFSTLGKFPEMAGILKYHVSRWSGRRQRLIEYK